MVLTGFVSLLMLIIVCLSGGHFVVFLSDLTDLLPERALFFLTTFFFDLLLDCFDFFERTLICDIRGVHVKLCSVAEMLFFLRLLPLLLLFDLVDCLVIFCPIFLLF